MGHLLFGFGGRTNRAKVWLFLLLLILAWTVVVVAAVAMIGAQRFEHLGDTTKPEELQALIASSLGAVALICVLALLTLYCTLAVYVKRLHDRNKSGLWVLLFVFVPGLLNGIGTSMQTQGVDSASAVAGLLSLIAVGINLWAFVELYCLRGTAGDNRYGPDPLAPHG